MTTERTSQAVAAVAMMALLAAGVGPAEVVGATALTLGAGLAIGTGHLARFDEAPALAAQDVEHGVGGGSA